MKIKLDWHAIINVIIITGLLSLLFITIGCSDVDTIDQDCGCVEVYSYSSIITSANGLPRMSYYSSEPESVPCQDEREWKESTSNSSIIGGYVDHKIICN